MGEAFIVSSAVSAGKPGEVIDLVAAASPKAYQKNAILYWGGDQVQSDPERPDWLLTRIECGCCSSIQAVFMAAQAILAEDVDSVVCGGSSPAAPCSPAQQESRRTWAARWMDECQLQPADLDDFVCEQTGQAYSAEIGFTPPYTCSAALGFASARTVGSLNLAPRGRLASRALIGLADPGRPVWQPAWNAAQTAIARADLSVSDLSCVWIQTSFPGVQLACLRAFAIPQESLLPHSVLPASACAAAGIVRVLETLEQNRSQYGLVLSIEEHRWAAAAIVERI